MSTRVKRWKRFRMYRIVGVCVWLLLGGCALSDDPDSGVEWDESQPNSPTGSFCLSGKFLGDLHGAQATATVQWSEQMSFDPGSPVLGETYTLVGGEIHSGPYAYSFTAELYGASGYGDMLDHTDNTRFRIRIDVLQQGFLLTANPFGGATQYSFACAD